MKRVTAGVYEKYIDAWDVCALLQSAGIDAKVVTKHAVQVHPEHVARAKEVLAKEEGKRAPKQ